MSLYGSIVKRKSFRSFTEKELEPSLMDELVDFISELNPPVEDIDWNFDTLPYVDMVKISSREPGIGPWILCSGPSGRISACKRPAISAKWRRSI
jgi:hypothetical protein